MSDEGFPLGAQLKNPVTVESLPSWSRSGDAVVRRGKCWFLVSLHESEPRWRRLLRWWTMWLRRWIDEH